MSIPRQALATAASGSNEGNSGDRRRLVVFEHSSSLIVDAFHRYVQTLPMIDRVKRLEEETDDGKKYKVQFGASVSQVTELVWTLHKNAVPDDDLAKLKYRNATAEIVHHGFLFTKVGAYIGLGALVAPPGGGVLVAPLSGDERVAAIELLNTNPAHARKAYGPLLQSEAFLCSAGPHPNENYTTKFQISPDGFEVERMTIVQRPYGKLPGATIARPDFAPGSGKSA
jgi:hypothetical protein